MYDTRNTHALAAALLDLMGCMNSPRQDEALLREAGVSLDRALFPLLVYLSRASALGIAELAGQVGRDASTVSRQIAKLEALGFVSRQPGREDLRIREAVITTSGLSVIRKITAARQRLLSALLRDWTQEDRDNLPRLMQRFASALKETVKE
ncbi:MarR family transcriptional regulator [Acerihabitans sp. KWT182]|uniref:MarR family transcriptional regulator n=1 Tax=Acerihabitans sp. KWT182 TaxID=3157919 RepID=A0AAU7QA65_9GAMM